MKVINTITTRRPAPRRGALRSDQYNDFQEEVVADISQLSSAVNSLHSRLQKEMLTIHNENAYLRRQVDALRNQQTYIEQVAGANGFLATRLIDLSDTKGITFPNDLDDTFSPMVSAEFGEATLPANAIENKFYVTSIRTGRIVPPSDLQVTVTGTFDKKDGKGLVNYERGGIVNPGKPEYAFNGNNQLRWQRRVEFPLDSKVDQVECELTVTVPSGSNTRANLIELYPFPNGSVDIIELATAADLGDTFITVPGFQSSDNLAVKRWHMSPTVVEQVKVRLRQRNWVEENGKKVFYYGLQELGLKLIDYDKSWVPGGAFGTNHTFVVKIPAPAGYAFKDLYRFEPTPNFLLEDMSQRHVHVRLTSTPDFSGSIFWDSDTNQPPQFLGSGITLSNMSTIYAIVQLNFVSSTGGSSSPFLVGTTPHVSSMGLSFTLSSI